MSFMDVFLGFNQIKMAPKDTTKTTFVIEWGIYCYTIMPFGLKNAGATYQRMVIALLHDMMHKEVKVYVENMIVKSNTREGHPINLQKFFEQIKKYQLRLNPQKCTFLSNRGIEVDLGKVKAILEMPLLRNEKEIRGFLGRLQYINRFIAKLTLTCELIFKFLKNGQPKAWNDECQKAFENIKGYLANPPILVPPQLGKPLLLYLSVLDNTLGSMLA